MRRLFWATLFGLLLSPAGLLAQVDLGPLKAALIGQPLYLRGLWMADKLEFDGDGKPIGESRPGSLTLSGIDVVGVSTHGKDLVLKGDRVALLLGPEDKLERHKIENVTLMFGTFQKKYIAHEEMSLIVHPDPSGSFEKALKAIFANGLDELASSAPIYWRCYAKGYFRRNVEPGQAQSLVQNCVRALSPAQTRDDSSADDTPVRVLEPVPPQYTPVAAAFGLAGTSEVHVTVTSNGAPVGFQVVHAIGGGLDEQSLAAIYQYKFQPASRNGKPVSADIDLTIQYGGIR